MEQANQDKPQVRSVTFYMLETGEGVSVPDKFSGVKFKKNGLPDKRDAMFGEFMAWVNAATRESVERATAPISSNDADLPVPEQAAIENKVNEEAQSVAMRIWDGQSVSLPRHERIGRVHRALMERGLDIAGLEFPDA